MGVKYIIDNVEGNLASQSINGNFTIGGNLNVTGITNDLGTYRALFTQTESFTGTSVGDFMSGLIIGETYTITNYVSGDSFSNVANVISGNIDETNCVFVATGETPYIWSNGSELVSAGNLVVDVLENTLGFDIYWGHNPFGGAGIYVGVNNTTGPLYNAFKRTTTSMIAQVNVAANNTPQLNKYYPQPVSYTAKDDVLLLYVYNFTINSAIDNALFYTPIEIKIKKDTDITPITISGTVTSSFPFNYASVDLICGLDGIESFFGDSTTVNNMSELVNQLNSNATTGYLGTYSEDGFGGLLLAMPTNLVRQFCSDGTLSFEVYSD